MTDVELEHLLAQFEQSATKLNDASNSINEIISYTEQRLVKANAGLPCWIEDQPLHVTEMVPVSTVNAEVHGKSLFQWHEIILGFTKLPTEGWSLVTRRRTALTEVVPYGEEAPPPSYEYSAPEPLAKAPRSIRIKALEMRPLLVERLQKAADEALEVIAQAKRIGVDRGTLN